MPKACKRSGLIGVRPATLDCRYNNHLTVKVQLIEDTKVANPSAKCAASSPQKSDVTLEWIIAHQ